MEERKQERTFELRSEKVRSIIGRIPSSLVRYGISVIGCIVIMLFGIAHILPYNQVYSGVSIIRDIPQYDRDSIEIRTLLHFDRKRPEDIPMNSNRFQLKTSTLSVTGILVHLSVNRDTLGRQEAICRLSRHDAKALLPHSETDFILSYQAGTYLDQLLSGFIK